MSTDDTNAARRGSGSNDLLGPLPEPEQPCWDCGDYGDFGMFFTAGQMRAYAAQQVAAERERCADIAERGDDGDWSASSGDYDSQRGKDIARVIRMGPNVEVTGRAGLPARSG